MKIAIITEFYHPFIGGVEVRFKELAEKFVEFGHEVDIYCIGHNNNLKKFEYINGVNIIRVFNDNSYYKNGILGRRFLGMVRFPFSTYKILNNKTYDSIIFGQFSIFPILLNKLMLKKKVNVIIDFVEYRFSKPWYYINSLLFKSVDSIVCINDFVENSIYKNHSPLKQNILTIPSSVNIKEYTNNSETYFIFIGRMEEHKNPEDAIRAVLLYNEKYKEDYELHLIGDGTLLNYLKEKYKEKNIIFHGFIAKNKKNQLLSHAKVLIFPSKREGLPMSFVESIASNVPIITANYPNNNAKKFIIDEKVGIVSETNINNLVESIDSIFKNYKTYQLNCEKIKYKYDLDKNSQKYLNFLQV